MFRQFNTMTRPLKAVAQQMLDGPQVLAILPAIVLLGYWIGGEVVLTLMAIGFPAVLAVYALLQPMTRRKEKPTRRRRDNDKTSFEDYVEKSLKRARANTKKTVCLVVGPDDYEVLVDQYGKAAARDYMDQVFTRLNDTTRGRDGVARIGVDKLGIVMAPVDHLNLDIILHVASRLQAAAEKPLTVGDSAIYISASIGFAQDTYFQDNDGRNMAKAAVLALDHARRSGPSSIRAYSPDMQGTQLNAQMVFTDIDQALDSGQIVPWFQPQISTDTGKVTGFEALARWEHPERGIVSPAEFLPKIQKAGKMERLCEIVLAGALDAIKTWDTLGVEIPQVGVNFSSEELRDPRLIKKIEWELDRLGLSPERLAVEILETVIATAPDDMIVRNISGLSDLGCQIDLDDFGTGHASISSLRRFNIHRLKVDRSFVTKVDQDPEQQRMVSAILLMAERLDLDILAEGIETAGEHAMLAQLGCGHVQGFGIGKPMPFDETEAWISAHLAKLSSPPEFGYKAG